MIKNRSFIEISSFSNPRIKYLIKLRDKRVRDKENQFTIEGYREIHRAFHSKKITFHAIFTSPEYFIGKNENKLIEKINTLTFVLPRKIFAKISYRDRPDGLLALCESPNFTFDIDKELDGDFFVIVEGVEKPGNLGTIIRTAEGAGVSSLIVADPRIDILNPNVIRSSTGILFTLPIYTCELKEIISYLKAKNIDIIGVSPECKTVFYDYNFAKPVALLFGSEQYGLSEFAKSNLDDSVSIPMKGEADSLNLAISSGIVMYEVTKQKSVLQKN
ncbi:MAG: RNA methyltransferase [Leptospiraceae bacterium]|nr:RNA methyltransferase [Leptospiraceae bacterium]MCP5497380.1 RNA methyltransferase [Leptospiraceae bacterium]